MSDTMETATPKPEVKTAQCSICKGKRNCDVVGHHVDSGKEETSDWFYSWTTEWFLLKCRGCDHVFVQTVHTNSEDYTNYYEDDGSTGTHFLETINYWPALAKRERPNWFSSLDYLVVSDPQLNDALRELYSALDHDLNLLAGIGIRTAFDVASELLGVDPALSFEEKLSELVDRHHIDNPDRLRLETLVEAGNASAHRGWKPSTSDLSTMMEVLEGFLHNAFIVPEQKAGTDAKLAKMKARVPQRQKRAKKAKREKLEG